MKNKLSDLNNHLFMEIERLGDEDLKGEALTEELGRADRVCKVAAQIIGAGRLVLDAAKVSDELPGVKKHPLLLE
jgi:hypothetical protein